MRAYPMVLSYSILEQNGKIDLDMCMSYDCKPFYASMSGTDVGVNSMFIEYSDVGIDGGYYDVVLEPAQADDVFKVLRAKMLELFKGKYNVK